MTNQAKRIVIFTCFTMMILACVPKLFAQDLTYGYRVLATKKTSTMEKEMNEAAAAGFFFSATTGGETAFGGNEAVVVMIRDLSNTAAQKPVYRLLATSKTRTMQKEMQQLGDEGFEYKGQTVFDSTFGGREVCVIMERDTAQPATKIEYKLLATSKTSTMQKELQEEGNAGFRLVGMTIAETAFGGHELVSILRKH